MTITRDELARVVAAELQAKTTYVDVDNDIVDGGLGEVIEAVVEVLAKRGPVVEGD